MSEVCLGQLLRPIERPEPVDPTRIYRLLGVRWYGEGLFEKESKMGQEIQAQRLFRVQEGDFVYNRLFAWKGSFAVADKNVDGCYVSNEFPCFQVNEEQLDVRFLRWWFHQEIAWSKALGLSQGATPTSRNRLKEEFFLAMKIPLPPLDVQRRVVAKIEELEGKIREAKSLRTSVRENLEMLLICMAHRPDLDDMGKCALQWQRKPLSACLKLSMDSHRVDVNTSYKNLGIFSFGKGLFHKPPIEGISTSASSLGRVKVGQFIYSRLFAFEGSYGIVTQEFDDHFVSNEYPTFDCIPELVRAEFLEAYFKAPSVWKAVAVGSKGLGDRRQRVQPSQVLNHKIWLPPMELQDRIAEVRDQVNEMNALRSDTLTEFNALLPSILNRAFSGQL